MARQCAFTTITHDNIPHDPRIPSSCAIELPLVEPNADGMAQTFGAIALLGVATFAAICGAAQFLRTDYNWLGVPLSFYVLGPYGRVVEAGYFALAPGLVALGIGWYLALDHQARCAAPLLLFVLVRSRSWSPQSNSPMFRTTPHFARFPAHRRRRCHLHLRDHGDAAAVLAVRGDPHWRARFRSAFILAAITFAALWIYALVKPIRRGLGEKVVIALILLYLWRASWWLLREPGR